MDKILIGKIAKPQGIKGELKIIPLTDTPSIFDQLDTVFIEDQSYTIISSRISDSVFLVLKGVADRTQAEAFRDKELYALREDIPVEENRWFIDDIIGCEVYLDNGEYTGRVVDITTRGTTDIFTVAEGYKTIMFPFLNELIISVDTTNKKIVLKTQRFAEVALYEN